MLNREETATIQLALGRIFRLASRPTQPGERPSWVRDRNKGAAGD